MSNFWAHLAAVAALAAGSGCQTARYYAQAVHGEWEILERARPTAAVLADPRTPAKVRRQLERAAELRAFAAEALALPVDKNYLKYTDLGRRFVVWNVHAAPEFSLEPKRWWFPFVGRVSYRGYFSKGQAEAYALALRERGWDVTVDGVEAYSTIGWFHDPLLNTFMAETPIGLAEILFHELTHRVLYVNGDTDFNEAFATATAELGVRQWLLRSGQAARLRRYEQEQRQRMQFIHLVLQARRRLGRIYAQSAPVEIELAEKEAAFDWLRQQYAALRKTWPPGDGYDEWFAKPLNNARLDTVATYYELAPGFVRLWRENGGNFRAYFKSVRDLSWLPRGERRQRLNSASATTSRQ